MGVIRKLWRFTKMCCSIIICCKKEENNIDEIYNVHMMQRSFLKKIYYMETIPEEVEDEEDEVFFYKDVNFIIFDKQKNNEIQVIINDILSDIMCEVFNSVK
jgi:hypothetical protein